MSKRDGPNRIMSSMNVPVEVSNLPTPFSISATNAWYFGSSRSPTVSPDDFFQYSRVIESSASSPEFDRVGSVWPSLTNPQSGLPPTAGQPRFEAIAPCSAFHVSFPSAALSSGSARSSQTTKTSGVITSGAGASDEPSAAISSEPVLVVQSAAPRPSTSESAGLQRTGFSLPSRVACIASSDPSPTSYTSPSECALENAWGAASRH